LLQAVFFFKKTSQKEIKNFELIKEEGYFIPLKIYGYSQTNIPFLEVNIGNMMIPAIIDLGFQGMFSLPVDLIKKIDEKKWIKHSRNYGLKGRIYEDNVYEFEGLKIENMSFPSVKMQDKCLESLHEGVLTGTRPEKYPFGAIGWELFTEYNLLVDCRYYILALCDSLRTLKQQNYPIDDFIEVPLISNSGFLMIEAETEKGILRCLLDTGCTLNMLNIDFENGSRDHQTFNTSADEQFLLNSKNEDSFIFNHEITQELSSFKVEGKELGPITFKQIKSPIEFDAILGMEFFDSHLVFIDFENWKVHIAPYPKETWPKPNLRPTIGPYRFYKL